MTKTNIKSAALAVAVAFASASVAKADLTGSLWGASKSGLTDTGGTSTVPYEGASVYSTSADLKFTVGDNFKLYNDATVQSGYTKQNQPGYTVSSFLSSGAAIVTSTAATFDPTAAGSLDLVLIKITGSEYYSAGQTIKIVHDDGAILYLNGLKVIDSAAETSPRTDSYTVTTSGTYSIDLLYAEVNGAPVELNFTAVPEPTTFLAGVLLLLPFGASAMRMVRKNKQA